MKEIGKMIKLKEKEYFIGKMVVNMKVILKMIKEKEKEYYIIIKVLEKWEIIQMVNLLEFILDYY